MMKNANGAGAKAKKDNKIVKFFRGTKSEFKKIVWPTPKQWMKNTLVVIVAVAICAVIITLLDMLFGGLILQGLLQGDWSYFTNLFAK